MILEDRWIRITAKCKRMVEVMELEFAGSRWTSVCMASQEVKKRECVVLVVYETPSNLETAG